MVDSVHPPAVVGRKGPAVRRLKYYVSWVQYDVIYTLTCVIQCFMLEHIYTSTK